MAMPRWTGWLRFRHRAVASQHQEIVQQAASDLHELMSTRVGAPLADEEIEKLGFTILRRRAADAYRDRSHLLFESLPQERVEDIAEAGDADRALRHKKIVRAIIVLLSHMDARDRTLLLRNEFPVSEPVLPLTAAQRKRLSRLRANLRQQLRERFQIDIDSELKEEP